MPDNSSTAPKSEADGDSAQKEMAASVDFWMKTLLVTAAFCYLTTAGHEDWELLATGSAGAPEGTIELPQVGVKLGFLSFLAVVPLLLIALQFYFLMQAQGLIESGAPTRANMLLRNNVSWWPISLLGLVGYALVPSVIACMLWKIWPLRYHDDPWLLGIHMNWLTVIVLFYLVLACLVSACAIAAHRHGLATLRDAAKTSPWPARIASFAIAGVLAFAMALDRRTLDLRKAPLDRADLRWIDLRGADLSEARLTGASMAGAILDDAILESAALDGADLRGAHLWRAGLPRARLNHADLRGAWLVHADMTDVELEGARLEYAWLQGARLSPVAATPLDRLAHRTEAERAYEKADVIREAAFDRAKLCGATLGLGHWSRDAAIGKPDREISEPPPYYDARAANSAATLPAGFGAQPIPEADALSQTSKDSFFAAVMDKCVAARHVCDRDDGVREDCPSGPSAGQ